MKRPLRSLPQPPLIRCNEIGIQHPQLENSNPDRGSGQYQSSIEKLIASINAIKKISTSNISLFNALKDYYITKNHSTLKNLLSSESSNIVFSVIKFKSFLLENLSINTETIY